MTLGAPPRSIGIQLDKNRPVAPNDPNTFPRYRFTTEHAVTTNPLPVEHTDQDKVSVLVQPPDLEDLSWPAEPEEMRDNRLRDFSNSDDIWTTTRSKSSTPKSFSGKSAHISPPDREFDDDLGAEERGRKRARLACIIPPRSRKISKRSVQRHVGHSHSGSGSAEAETFLTSESPSPSNSSKEGKGLVLEPSPAEHVSRGLHERLSEPTSPASPEEGVPFPYDQDLMAESAPLRRSNDPNRLSIIDPIHFVHHRDTFAVLALPKNQPLPPSPLELSNLPYHVLCHVDSYLNRCSRLALRSTCRWLRDAISEIRPIRVPAVSKLPAEMIYEILSYLSPFEFNSARHTCRTWMRISLDKSLLARMIRRAAWWNSVEMTMRCYLARTDAVEDDFPAVWLLSSILARECAISPYGSGHETHKKRSATLPAVKCAQIDSASDQDFSTHSHQPFELVLETDFSTLEDPKVHGNAVATYAQARGLHGGVHFTASVCSRFVLVTQGSQIFIYRLSHAADGDIDRPESRVEFGSTPSVSRTVAKTAIVYPVTTIICPRRVLAVTMDTSCGRHAVAALLNDRMGLVCDLFASDVSTSSTGLSGEVSFIFVALFLNAYSG